MPIVGSDPVLAVHDLELSAAWYRDVLGCQVDEVDPGNWTFCRAGGVTFMLGRCPDVPAASELGDHSYIAYLRVDDVASYYRKAVAAGAEVLKDLREIWRAAPRISTPIGEAVVGPWESAGRRPK